MMSEELHPVVKLLLARIKSHPDEFASEGDVVETDSIQDRWWPVVRNIREYGAKEEQAALAAAMREVRLQKAHEMMMDELCNGEERRRKEREQRELELQKYTSHHQYMAHQAHLGSALRAGTTMPVNPGEWVVENPPTRNGLVATMKKALGL